MKRGLEQLRTVTEDLRLSRISEIKLIDLEAQPAIAIIDSAKAEHIDSLMKSMFASLRTYLDRRAIAPTGDPVRIYYTWNPEGLSRFACALPIEKRTWGWLQYQVIELPAGKAATIHHWGKTDSPKPYLALDDYLKTNNLEQGSFIWEIYITPPEATSDTSLWQKQVFYPVGLEM
jgi:effector-binding domain-containing protein